MTIPVPEICPHETRPGTVVCLHCRHDARMAIRAERQRKMGRVFVVLVIVGVLGAAVSAGASAMQSHWDWREVLPTLAANLGSSSSRASTSDILASSETTPAPAAPSAPAVVSSDSISTDSLAVDATTADTPGAADSAAASLPGHAPATDSTTSPAQPVTSPTSTGAPSAPATATASPAAMPAIVPRITEGRTELGDSVFAMRQGSIVTVHFDTPMGRTRRRDKFENMVRTTLPRIYGAAADSALTAIPVGALTGTSDLLAELPSAGIRIALANGATLSIWPRTRPGRDGPLVVAYRAVVSR